MTRSTEDESGYHRDIWYIDKTVVTPFCRIIQWFSAWDGTCFSIPVFTINSWKNSLCILYQCRPLHCVQLMPILKIAWLIVLGCVYLHTQKLDRMSIWPMSDATGGRSLVRGWRIMGWSVLNNRRVSCHRLHQQRVSALSHYIAISNQTPHNTTVTHPHIPHWYTGNIVRRSFLQSL